MSFLSVCMYILAQHRLLLMFGLPLMCLVLALLQHRFCGKRWGYFLIPTAFTLGMVNMFTGQWVNGAFLNWFGTPGTAIIVDKRDAGWLLNEQRVDEYDVLVRTEDGRDVVAQFDDMSASIWPPRNLILLPALNDPFVVKYVPGFPRNIVIMSDESAYGKRWLLNDARRPVERARNLYEASPGNARFAREYRQALQDFLGAYGEVLSASDREQYEKRLEAVVVPAS